MLGHTAFRSPVSTVRAPAATVNVHCGSHPEPRLGLEETRSIVVVQSVLLALSILAASLWLARRRGMVAGIALAISCLLFLRLRDAANFNGDVYLTRSPLALKPPS